MVIHIMNLHDVKPNCPWDVRVDRANKIIGNPYRMASEDLRDEVCDKYAEFFDKSYKESEKFREEIDRLVQIYQRYNKIRLFCWCAPKRCHAETIKSKLEEILSRQVAR